MTLDATGFRFLAIMTASCVAKVRFCTACVLVECAQPDAVLACAYDMHVQGMFSADLPALRPEIKSALILWVCQDSCP